MSRCNSERAGWSRAFRAEVVFELVKQRLNIYLSAIGNLWSREATADLVRHKVPVIAVAGNVLHNIAKLACLPCTVAVPVYSPVALRDQLLRPIAVVSHGDSSARDVDTWRLAATRRVGIRAAECVGCNGRGRAGCPINELDIRMLGLNSSTPQRV